MKSNALATLEPPYDINLVTRIWCAIYVYRVFSHGFPKYLKLTELTLVRVIKSVKDECVFSSVSFLQTKLHNSLDPHLGVVVGMYSQNIFTLHSFPCDSIFDSQTNVADVHCRYGHLVQNAQALAHPVGTMPYKSQTSMHSIRGSIAMFSRASL